MSRFYKLYSFDVWGNEKDGWEVNETFCETLILFPDHPTDRQILQALKDLGFLRPHVRLNMLTIEEPGPDVIEISQRRDGKPICCLRYADEPA